MADEPAANIPKESMPHLVAALGATAAYLLTKPMLADHLEEGLSAFGCSCEDFEKGHL